MDRICIQSLIKHAYNLSLDLFTCEWFTNVPQSLNRLV